MAKRRGFKVDLHIHSMFSGESDARPEHIVEAALEKGLDGICITEHESLFASAPFDRIKNCHGLIIMRGVELATDIGHMLVYGVDEEDWRDWGKNKVVHFPELICRVKGLGGVVVPAHPCTLVMKDPYDCEPEVIISDEIRNIKGVAALEVCNGKQLYPTVCRILGALAKSLGLPGTGGSDAHLPKHVGKAFTVFKTPVNSSKNLGLALRSGRFYPQTA